MKIWNNRLFVFIFEVIGDIYEGGAIGVEEGVFGFEVIIGGEGFD